jgi:hypothetical protein
MPLEYMIMKDDVEMVAQVVQDRTFEDFENVARQRDRIVEELAYMRQLLRHIREAQTTDSSVEMGPSTSQIGGKPGASEHDTIQTIAQFNVSCHTQHATHGKNRGENTPKRLGSTAVGIAADTNQGTV